MIEKADDLLNFIKDSSNDVRLIIICANEIERDVEYLLESADKRETSRIYTVNESNIGKAKEQFAFIRKDAAKAWLFNLAVGIKINADLEHEFYDLCFQLKNLGFCGIINLTRDNEHMLKRLCVDLNLYYRDF